jgi:hypothetical protein
MPNGPWSGCLFVPIEPAACGWAVDPIVTYLASNHAMTVPNSVQLVGATLFHQQVGLSTTSSPNTFSTAHRLILL